jgi:hypothetical protein
MLSTQSVFVVLDVWLFIPVRAIFHLSTSCHHYRWEGCKFRPMPYLLAARVFLRATPAAKRYVGLYGLIEGRASTSHCIRTCNVRIIGLARFDQSLVSAMRVFNVPTSYDTKPPLQRDSIAPMAQIWRSLNRGFESHCETWKLVLQIMVTAAAWIAE